MAAKKTTLLIILTAVLIVLAGCGSGSSKDKLPDEVQKARDNAMKVVQNSAHEMEGSWVDRVANLESYAKNGDAADTAEYKSLQGDLADYAKECKADRLYVMAVKNDEYLIVLDTAKGTSWHDKAVIDVEAASKAYSDGLISAEHTGWQANDKYYWTAYSPLYNQNNEIAFVLGADKSRKKLADYPDWLSEKGGE